MKPAGSLELLQIQTFGHFESFEVYQMLNGTIIKQIRFLAELAKRTSMDDQPYVRQALMLLSNRWNDNLAAGLYKYLYDQVDGSLFIEDVFELPKTNEIDGEMELGKVKDKQSIPFKHCLENLPMHILAAGTSGSGKTNFAKILVEQSLIYGVKNIMISDPKSEYDEFAMKHPDFLLLRWDDLRFNPFKPPPMVPENEWTQTVIGHLSQSFNFWEGVMSLLFKLIDKDQKHGKVSNIHGLISEAEKIKAKFQYKDYLTKATATSRLELMKFAFGKVITSQGEMLPVLRKKNYILQTTGMMSEMESWLLEFLLLWEYTYRRFNQEDSDLVLHVYDESQHRLFNSEKEKNIKKIGASIISKLVDESRSSNLAICALSQEPSTLIKAILNNSYLKLCFHLGSGEEVKIMQSAMGLNDEQGNSMHYLETGEAIVRTGGGVFIEPCPVKIHEWIKPCGVSPGDFLNHQQTTKQELYRESSVLEIGRVGETNRRPDNHVETENPQDEIGELFEENYDVL